MATNPSASTPPSVCYQERMITLQRIEQMGCASRMGNAVIRRTSIVTHILVNVTIIITFYFSCAVLWSCVFIEKAWDFSAYNTRTERKKMDFIAFPLSSSVLLLTLIGNSEGLLEFKGFFSCLSWKLWANVSFCLKYPYHFIIEEDSFCSKIFM